VEEVQGALKYLTTSISVATTFAIEETCDGLLIAGHPLDGEVLFGEHELVLEQILVLLQQVYLRLRNSDHTEMFLGLLLKAVDLARFIAVSVCY